MPEQYRAGIAGLISEVAAGTDTRLKTQALAQLGGWLTWFPAGIPVLTAAITDLTNRKGWRGALNGLVGAITLPEVEAAFLDIVQALAVATGPDAEADRDRPGLQRMRSLVDYLAFGENRRSPLRDIVGRLADAFADYPEVRPEVTGMHLSTVRVHSIEAAEDMQAITWLVADRPVLAAAAGRDAWGIRTGRPYHWNRDAMLAAARNVSNGHLAVSILATGGTHYGWPEEWRALLRELRRHADPDVRDAALQVMTSSES